MKNINKLLGWMKWIRKTLKSLGDLYAVHACDLDTGIAAHAYCKRFKVKFVYDIFDYYIDSHHIPAVLRSAVERMEIKAINYADATIICTDERREQIAKARPKKLAVIHNSPEIKQMPNEETEWDYVYCGGLSGGRLVKEILDHYPQNSDTKLSLAGYGPYAEQAAALANEYENFQFLGTISYSRVLELEARACTLSAIYEPTIRNHRLCAPNKFYEALALGKPVIVCKGTGIDKIVEENNIGCVIDYDAEQFYAALRKLCADSELRKQMGVRARALYDKKYNWDIMKGILLETYRGLNG